MVQDRVGRDERYRVALIEVIEEGFTQRQVVGELPPPESQTKQIEGPGREAA